MVLVQQHLQALGVSMSLLTGGVVPAGGCSHQSGGF